MDLQKLKRTAIARFSMGIVMLGAIFFWTAGTFRYWEAWLFMATVFIPGIFLVRYFLRHDPELLERRLQSREERTQQKVIQLIGAAAWIGIFLIPGLDRRFGWTEVPAAAVVLAAVAGLTGYYIMFLTMKENRFASRTIKVEEGQVVITTGPYALVRHPMYVGAGLLLLCTPLVLGSYWALIPALLVPLFLVVRILDEEKLLQEELPGYREYMEKTRYRLIPRVW
jgi:protein-S-isoprenylcysteine O-methyltransferase Ste14